MKLFHFDNLIIKQICNIKWYQNAAMFLVSFNKIQNNEYLLIQWSRLFDTTEKST